MRPHRLRLTAFGPFPGTVEVDLDSLSAGGLFLLHGETGAGKTTVLDGLGFALYGTVPGQRGKAKRLRSDHAEAATRTEVELEVTIAGRRLRVTRSPEQQRRKLRGSGTTTEPAKVLLAERAGDGWVTVSTRVGEADAEIKRLLGMSADQFFQVVLLPQGDFARFLRADAEERAALLERLFGTDRFGAVEEWLAARRRATAEALAGASHDLDRLTARVIQAAGELAAEPDDRGVTAGWAAELARRAVSEAEAAHSVELRRRAALDQALAAAEAARSLADRQRRRAEALRRRERVDHAAASMTDLGVELDAAARAAEVGPTIAERERTARALVVAERAEANARRSAERAGAPAGCDVPMLRRLAEERRERLGRLDGLREQATAIAAEEAAARAALDAARDAATDAERLQAALAALPARRSDLEAGRVAARDAVDALGTARLGAAALRHAAADAAALVTARAETSQLVDALTGARERAVTLRERAVGLREARFDGMVAELAHGLEDGTPCPVCGALDHPEPAEPRARRVSRDEEDAATAAADQARTEVEQLSARHAAAAARVEDLAGRLAAAGHHAAEPAALAERAAVAEAEVSRLERVAAGLGQVEQALDGLLREERELAERITALRERERAARREADAAAARAAAARSALAGALEGAPDLDAALVVARSAGDAFDSAADAGSALAQARSEAERAAATAESAARHAGFATVAAATAATRSSAWRRDAARRLEDHHREAAALGALLSDPDLAVPLDPAADIAGTEAALDSATAAHRAAAAEHGRLGQRARDLAELAPQVEDALDRLVPLAECATQVRALADLAAGLGANTYRMTLSAFVLAARLEEVAQVASERLLRMSAGRYTLVHTDAGRGAGRAGLGLLVRDAWTGHDRDTSTLSGGETFLASLALALGLADVVTAESGGARMEALFVDEGFGSLDDATLDEVMDVLDGLREGGRMVGLVSHVGELKQRIPTQVHVRKGRAGSRVELVGC